MIVFEDHDGIKSRYNDEDMVNNHNTICAVIKKDNKYLCQDHVKHNMITFPVGKVKRGDSIQGTVAIEVGEETGIKVNDCIKTFTFTKTYDFDGKPITIHCTVFEVTDWSGTPKNKEPKKHKWVKWLTRKEIEELGKKRKLADSTIEYFKWLDGEDIKLK